ncbi:small multi-drug export protein [Candidatus Uhrbacteria bacterium]|nr:small multi-drug export protein [Candidatus Uhrbacteria bacterium]
MIQVILEFLHGLPHELTTVIIAAMPVVEVRLSIPVAIEFFNMPVWKATVLSFIGASIPAIVLPLALAPLEKPCRKAFPWCDRMFDVVINHVQKRFTERYQTLGIIGLILFVAIPLPGTGVWTGSLASWVFRIKKKVAIPAILTGLALSSLIVAAATMGVFGAINLVV